MYSVRDRAKALGCPIRKSSDQSLLPAPQRLSQSVTSFIASICQGIHELPFSHLRSVPCTDKSPHYMPLMRRARPFGRLAHGHSADARSRLPTCKSTLEQRPTQHAKQYPTGRQTGGNTKRQIFSSAENSFLDLVAPLSRRLPLNRRAFPPVTWLTA